jgi:pimeloyl-ACP methyl ester carboxylesterase
MTRVPIAGAELETVVLGSGDPVVLVPTALTADELRPLAERLRECFSVVHYRRRGYGGSSPAAQPGSVARDSADCARLLAALGIERVHLLGTSYSAGVALQLAVDHPEVVHTLTLVEPPPVHGPGDAAFRAAADDLLRERLARGPEAAVDRFFTVTMGSDWRGRLDDVIPGGSAEVLRDGGTFFDVDVPALLDWPFDATAAARVRAPVLHVEGSEHGVLFEGVGELIRAWLPHVQQVTIADAGHDVALTHPDELAASLVPFLSRHPIA